MGSRTAVRRAAALALAGGLALAACGGDDDDAAGDPQEAGSDSGSGSGMVREGQESESGLERETQEALSQLDAEMREGDAVITLSEQVLFDTGEYELLPDATATLDDVVTTIDYYADAPVQVNGHTDAEGSDADNQTLSEQRAQAVVDHLQSAGVDGGRLTPQGFGESQPVGSNDTEDGRAQNRRVEVVIEGADLGAVEG